MLSEKPAAESAGGSPDVGRWPYHVFRWELAALFFVAVAVKWWLVGYVGSDLPWIDQWGPEAELYRRWLAGSLRWTDFFAPANEHRIVFTHLLNLGLLWLNGQWDPLLQMMVNAVLNAAEIVFLAWWIGRRLPTLARRLLLATVAVVLVAPFGIQNVAWGFQSPVYLCLLFSFAALRLTTGAAFPGWRWWAGAVLAVAAYFAMAPGVMVGAALLAWVVWRWIGARRCETALLPHALLGSGLLVLAWLLRVPVPRHVVLQAPDIASFVQVLAGVLSWPICDPRLFVLLNAPVVLLLVGRLTGRIVPSGHGETALLLAAWAVGVALSFAWFRGGVQNPFAAPPPRHADFFALLPIANALALAELGRLFGRRRALLLAGTGLWSLAFLWGAGRLMAELQGDIREHARLREQMEFEMLAFRARGERGETLHYTVDALTEECRACLSDPVLRPVLPPLLQDEMPVIWPPDGPLLRPAKFAPGSPIPESLTLWATPRGPERYAVGTERSEPFFCAGPAVEVFAAAAAQSGQVDLALVAEDSDHRIELPPAGAAPGRWGKRIARVPPGRYRLEANHRDGAGWAALSAPRKVGAFGYWMRRLLGHRTLLLLLACGAFAVVFLLPRRTGVKGKSPV